MGPPWDCDAAIYQEGAGLEGSIHRASGSAPPRRIVAAAVPRKSFKTVLAILASRRHCG
ncbi:hypothetical protein SS05631_c37070 [Sinorhizobium sp. CCBAU 05631]|nr:hypothetical protein SS05631_c37070 [Sinorhizobium sp. CCBAU 05631]